MQPVAVIGGGNPAGQAALFLADTARRVYLLVRDSNLAAKMSRYLADQIVGDDPITVMTHTQIRELRGDEFLTSIAVEDTMNGSRTGPGRTGICSSSSAHSRNRRLLPALWSSTSMDSY